MKELIIGIISSIISTIVVAIYYEVKIAFSRVSGISRLFKLNKKKPLRICYANVQNSKYVSPILELIPTGGIDYGDADSILLVYDNFRSIFKKNTRWIRNEIPDNSMNGNIVCIAGPKWNKTTELLIGKIGSPLYYSTQNKGLVEKRRNHINENIYPFKATRNDNVIEIEDFGCVICGREKVISNDIDSAIIVSGYTTYGTLFAAQALNSFSKREIRRLGSSITNDKKFALIVKGIIKLDLNGKIASDTKITIINWIPERDFCEPYNYKYDRVLAD